jgi:RecJ-like exonuclease
MSALCPLCEGQGVRMPPGWRYRVACAMCGERGRVGDELAVLVRLASSEQIRKIDRLCLWARCEECRGTGSSYSHGVCEWCSGRGRHTLTSEEEFLAVFS